jgi:hypothetical protein
MTAAARPRHEPDETEEPLAALLNAMLDQVDETMRAIVRHGGEAALRARVEKHFPPAEPKPERGRTERIIADGETALGISYCNEVLRRHRERVGAGNRRDMTQTGIDVLLKALKGEPKP